ncbi:hypothetical protein [Plebeiibacterium sediminum]|uniref:Uncharacterized protein n=1 Tax=Plebeiibacterium sediminum TaxID=2992112 RepID=A0AAE3M163_9BACT|nr:hypothetical protein [Plebeiobacterium sediminum]MCW3784917.1 hypothetical protein [Plebeiobacterium sediminum]
MKDFLEKLQEIMEAMGLKKKVSDLSKEEKTQFAEKYKEVHGSDLDEDLKAYKENKEKNESLETAFADLAGILDQTDGAGANDKTPAEQVAEIKKQIADLKKKNGDKDAKIKKLQEEKTALEQEMEHDDPKKVNMKVAIVGLPHSETHLFGIQHAMYSLDKRWNQLMVDRTISSKGLDEEATFNEFQKETRDFGNKVAARMQELHESNMLRDPEKLQADVDYTGLSGAGLGDQFVVRRTDALIARFIRLKNVYDIFPRRYGIEDRELITNAFFDEFSQPYQEGEVWKGGMSLKPEVGYVDDAMMKTLFKNWKWIERSYIAYLNQDGSDPIKWNMIEWAILQIAEKLTNEQYKRKIVGVFRKPVANRPAHANHASTGVIFTLIRYVHEYKLLPIEDAAYAEYTNTGTDMIDTVEAFVEKVKEVYEGDIEDLTLYLNKNHKTWYKSGYRQKYGADGDFSAVVDGKLQDEEVNIIWVPNMGSHQLMFMQKPGNIQCLENLPGEMFKIKFKEEMESVKAWSIWKEGTSAEFVGKPFTTKAELEANNFELQEIFMNKPAFKVAAEATTLDANNGFWQMTQDNGAARNLTDISNSKEGTAYIIECAGTTNATTVNKSGKFDSITATYTPTAVGDYLMVVYDKTDDKFYELERCVGGVRTINANLQPNTPGNGGR